VDYLNLTELQLVAMLHSGYSHPRFCQVDFMPFYKDTLKQAILREVGNSSETPLSGLNIVVNPGNGAGCFFNDLLRDLGANVEHSLHLNPDGTFPETSGVPNPEKKVFVGETTRACEASNADIGVMFDTDADRAGFVLPRIIDTNGVKSGYEPLNRNRLIALLSVIFSTSSPGCTIVTDSTTSEGLNMFLEKTLGLKHFRFLRGYANVIGKAQELTNSGEANAEVAIETSGHCAMKENGYIDDGTYTAVKIIGLLARTVASGKGSLLDLIADLNELPFDEEYRLKITDGSLATTSSIFQQLSQELKDKCNTEQAWTLDEQNLEGVRVRLSSGGFFMIRQSLHDPVISLQVESISGKEAGNVVLEPLLQLFSDHASVLDASALE
jgi:phosphomannomutase